MSQRAGLTPPARGGPSGRGAAVRLRQLGRGLPRDPALGQRQDRRGSPDLAAVVYGAYKASVESHLKAYHAEYGMNTSAWRPAAVYGVDPDLRRSQWYNLVHTAREGGTVDTPQGGKITHVQDVADAPDARRRRRVGGGPVLQPGGPLHVLAAGGGIRAGDHRADAKITTRREAVQRTNLTARRQSRSSTGTATTPALRRGLGGVREYVGELLGMMERSGGR